MPLVPKQENGVSVIMTDRGRILSKLQLQAWSKNVSKKVIATTTDNHDNVLCKSGNIYTSV